MNDNNILVFLCINLHFLKFGIFLALLHTIISKIYSRIAINQLIIAIYNIIQETNDYEEKHLATQINFFQFQGRWYEVQAYPKEQQPGQCVSHDFSLNGTTFNLVTNGVDDQFAVVSNSVVSLATNDSSAKMTITITANGQGTVEFGLY